MYRDEIIPLADVLTPNDFEARYVCESCRLANHGVFCIIVFFLWSEVDLHAVS